MTHYMINLALTNYFGKTNTEWPLLFDVLYLLMSTVYWRRAHAHAGAGAAERERGGHAVVAGGRARGRARRAHAVPHAAEHHAQQAAVLCE